MTTYRLNFHNFRLNSFTNIPILHLSPVIMSITHLISRNFRPIYSANNPIGVSLLAGQR